MTVTSTHRPTPKKLSHRPLIDPTARIIDSTLGRWTEVYRRTTIQESVLGDYSYVTEHCHIIYATIGKFCSIASYSRINPGNHPMDRVTQHHFTYRSEQYELGSDDDTLFDWRRSHSVELGHDVWVGHRAILLPGVKVGTGAVVAAGAVVSKDVPPYTIVGGVPATTIRQRFDDTTQQALFDLAWWDWPHDRLRAALPDFRTLPVEAFVAKYGAR